MRKHATWWHATAIYTCCHLRTIKLRQNERVYEGLYDMIIYDWVYMIWERVRIFELQEPKYRYQANLLAPIVEIGYFTFFNNSDVIHRVRRFRIPFYHHLMTCMRQAIPDKKVLCNGTTRGRARLLLFLSDVCKDTEAPYTRQCKSVDSVQTGNQFETRVQRSREYCPIRISAIYVVNVGKSMDF